MFEEQVSKGIEVLNRNRPNWRDKIDIEALDTNDWRDCVLGQVFGSYSDGMDALLPEFSLTSEHCLSVAYTVFDMRTSFANDNGFDARENVRELTLEWKRVLA